MKTILWFIAAVAFSAATISPSNAQQADANSAAVTDAAGETPAVSEAETAIRKAIDSYIEAFNKGDAQALANHWGERGEFVPPNGELLSGRQQLAESFSAYFEESKGAKLEIVDVDVKLISPSVALETGVARVIVPEQEPTETMYETVHVKTAEGWKMDSVREQALPEPPPSNYERLRPLEWMLGRWVDAAGEGVVETDCRWTTNRNFISRSFRVVLPDGGVDFEGTQIIGWDPANETIRSWLFDSDGGFAVGRWSNDRNRWTVQSLHIMPDGRKASSTNIYDLSDDAAVEFRSIGRQVDGELLPSVGPIHIVRAGDE